jgi:putative transposase
VAQARTWALQFVQWYNHQHKHSGLKFVTPAQRHGGLAEAILRHREQVYEAAKAALPGTLVRGDKELEIEGRGVAQS